MTKQHIANTNTLISILIQERLANNNTPPFTADEKEVLKMAHTECVSKTIEDDKKNDSDNNKKRISRWAELMNIISALTNNGYIKVMPVECIHKQHSVITAKAISKLTLDDLIEDYQTNLKTCCECDKQSATSIDSIGYCRQHAIIALYNELSEDELKAVKDHIDG
jgi:hypothetical protein